MAAPHLTLAIASSALFDLSDSDAVYRSQGIEAYRSYQRERENELLPTGVAFPFIRRLLAINRIAPATPLVEVVLISRNDPDTGVCVHNSLDHHHLHVERSVFTGGRPPYHYIDDFHASLFLSVFDEQVLENLACPFRVRCFFQSSKRFDQLTIVGGDEKYLVSIRVE